ncbi:MAG: aspartyl/asparaginyl beta-hydroxylase domain-containing protein [Pyrinomonadaceae bacterium]|nr:aspartyl/asparaginyl beta-hydroxylase domain-containing protein [Pyrinomonadaceae bacterium]
MADYKKLPLTFDPAKLQADLSKVADDEWIRHFNQGYYEGNWSVASLRSVGGHTKQIFPNHNSEEPYADTAILERCQYIREVLNEIKCGKSAVRFMLLGAGSRIREHRDYFMGVEDNCLRLHIPVVTNKDVEFYLNDQKIEMQTGELWYLDFYQKHRVENNGTEDRIHLVIDCDASDWLIDIIS